MKLVYSTAAMDEVIAQVILYEEDYPGRGVRFHRALRRVERLLIATPAMGHQDEVDASLRYCRLARFPFNVVYRIEDDVIHIEAVAHTSRRPGYWRER